MMDYTKLTREELSEQLKKDVQEYLAKGGKLEQLGYGVCSEIKKPKFMGRQDLEHDSEE